MLRLYNRIDRWIFFLLFFFLTLFPSSPLPKAQQKTSAWEMSANTTHRLTQTHSPLFLGLLAHIRAHSTNVYSRLIYCGIDSSRFVRPQRKEPAHSGSLFTPQTKSYRPIKMIYSHRWDGNTAAHIYKNGVLPLYFSFSCYCWVCFVCRQGTSDSDPGFSQWKTNRARLKSDVRSVCVFDQQLCVGAEAICNGLTAKGCKTCWTVRLVCGNKFSIPWTTPKWRVKKIRAGRFDPCCLQL